MRHSSRFLTFLPALMPALCFALVLAGCDGNSEADQKDFAVFEQHDWEVDAFFIDGNDRTRRLENQYDSPVSINFSEESGNDRSFELFARISGPETDRRLAGRIRIDGGSDEMDFFPSRDFNPFQVDYQILRNDRIVLTTEDDERDGLILRNILLPNSTLGDDFPEVRIVIAAP